MSQENVEVIGEAFAAWLRGDDRWLEAMDPEIEWDMSSYPLPDLPEPGKGRDNFARLLAEFRASSEPNGSSCGASFRNRKLWVQVIRPSP